MASKTSGALALLALSSFALAGCVIAPPPPPPVATAPSPMVVQTPQTDSAPPSVVVTPQTYQAY